MGFWLGFDVFLLCSCRKISMERFRIPLMFFMWSWVRTSRTPAGKEVRAEKIHVWNSCEEINK